MSEWVYCGECIYLEDCENSEDRGGCYMGDVDVMCEHWECPYKYCPYHENYDEELEVVCKSVIPDEEKYKDCRSYLDI